MEKAIQTRYRVYCLTTHPSNILMWSHYANSHRRICLEFSCQNVTFSGVLKVSYYDAYPAPTLASDEDNDNIQPQITRGKAWDYEDEYRLIAQEKSGATADDTLVTKNDLLKFPPDALTAVILGCLVEPPVTKQVQQLLARAFILQWH